MRRAACARRRVVTDQSPKALRQLTIAPMRRKMRTPRCWFSVDRIDCGAGATSMAARGRGAVNAIAFDHEKHSAMYYFNPGGGVA